MEINWYLGLLSGIAKIKFTHKPIPLLCHWEITYRCNLNCVFCSSRFNVKAWSPETTTLQALDILSQVARMGGRVLNLTGGEPTMRDDLSWIIKYAHALGMKVSITTNGVMEEGRRHWLLEADVVRISLEGAPLLNNALRQSGADIDSTAESIKTLKFLSEHGKHPLIVSVYSAKTRQEDIEFLMRLAQELAIKITFYPINCDFSDKRGNFTPQDREERRRKLSDILLPIEVFLERIAALKRRYPDCISPNRSFLTIFKLGGLDKFGCLAMNTAICLKPDGSVVIPCIAFPEEIVKSNDLFSVFYGEKAERSRKKQGKYWFCNKCQINCMISSTSLVNLRTLFHTAREYLPLVF